MLKDLSTVLKQPSTPLFLFLNSSFKQSFQESYGQMKMNEPEEIFLCNCTLLNSEIVSGATVFEKPKEKLQKLNIKQTF